jgi:hypothetical protein
VSKEIVIACIGAGELSIDLMTPLQDDFKTLSDERYQELKAQILAEGFSAPIFVWEDPSDSLTKILDGHQRHTTLVRLREEDYKIPQIPVVYVEADNVQQAIRKLAGFASQYGQVSDEGFARLLQKYEIELKDIASKTYIPGIDYSQLESLMNIDYGEDNSVDVEAHKRDLNGKPVEDKKEFLILVTCEDEKEQSSLYESLNQEGFKCKLID